MTKMLVTLKFVSVIVIYEKKYYNSPSGESPVERILDVDDIETTNVLLPVYNDTSPAHVASTGNHDDVTSIELDKVGNLALLNIELDGVVNTDKGVRVTNSAAVVGDDVGNTTVSESDAADLQEFVGGLLGSDAVDGEAALNIVEKTEVLARLLDGDDVYS